MGFISRYLPQSVQERGREIRTFMPRFGCINERRNQLHEVIRLSGMNLIIDDTDHARSVMLIPGKMAHRRYLDPDAPGRIRQVREFYLLHTLFLKTRVERLHLAVDRRILRQVIIDLVLLK